MMFLLKDKVLIRFGFVWVFLARKGSGCPSEGKFLLKEKAFVRFGLFWHFWLKMVQVAPIKGKNMSQIEREYCPDPDKYALTPTWHSVLACPLPYILQVMFCTCITNAFTLFIFLLNALIWVDKAKNCIDVVNP